MTNKTFEFFEITDEIEKLDMQKESLIKKLEKKHVLDIFNYLKNKFPILESISWTQYTPYFNDGESCEFNVHIDSHSLNVNNKDMYSLRSILRNKDEEELILDKEELTDLVLSSVGNEAVNLLLNFPTSYFERIFGDHIEVIVREGQVEVRDYEHD